MKTFTLLCFVTAAGLVITSGCKKLSSSRKETPAPDPGYTINPNTAHIIADYDFNDTTLTNHGWAKTFEDNFDGDLSKWYVEKGGSHGELQLALPANATTSGGILQLTAKRETVSGPTIVDSAGTSTFNFSSAWLISKSLVSACTSTPHVRIVVRMKTVTSYGLSTVLFSHGDNWPVNGEIVMAQVNDNNRKQYGTSYSYGTTPGQDLVKHAYQFNPTDGDLSTAYHVYVTDWSQGQLTYYIDGSVVEIKTAGGYVASMFDRSHHLSVKLAVGGHYYDGADPSGFQGGSMYVDYIKVFTSK